MTDFCKQHYEWEIQNADGEWIDGDTSNDLSVARAQARTYLQQYAEDGMHKLIIRRHRITTIMEEELND